MGSLDSTGSAAGAGGHSLTDPPTSAARTHVLLQTGPVFALRLIVSFAYNWYYLTGGFHADVLAVEFRMARPLSDPSLLFLQWDGRRFRPIDVAALSADQPTTLADTSDIWAGM